MKDKISAVVVTYNRLNLLKECVKSLRAQSLKLDEIIIINNDSIDGTRIWLDEQKDLTVYHQENLGGAGGFYRGISEAYDKGWDWIWVMDDDSEPQLNCLENCMIAAKKHECDVLDPLLLKTNGFPDKAHRGNIMKKIFDIKNIPHQIHLEKIDTEYTEYIDFSSFVGPIYSRRVIQKIGLPNPNFFLHHDDFEYSLRIKDGNFKTLLIYNAFIIHKEAAHKFIKSTTFNFNLPVHKSKLYIKYFSPRNKAFIIRQRMGIVPAILISVPVLMQEFIRHLFSKPSLLPSRLFFFYSAISDGITRKLDNTKPGKILARIRD